MIKTCWQPIILAILSILLTGCPPISKLNVQNNTNSPVKVMYHTHSTPIQPGGVVSIVRNSRKSKFIVVQNGRLFLYFIQETEVRAACRKKLLIFGKEPTLAIDDDMVIRLVCKSNENSKKSDQIITEWYPKEIEEAGYLTMTPD